MKYDFKLKDDASKETIATLDVGSYGSLHLQLNGKAIVWIHQDGKSFCDTQAFGHREIIDGYIGTLNI